MSVSVREERKRSPTHGLLVRTQHPEVAKFHGSAFAVPGDVVGDRHVNLSHAPLYSAHAPNITGRRTRPLGSGSRSRHRDTGAQPPGRAWDGLASTNSG